MSENRIQRPTEFRAAEEGGERYIEGYFIVFDDTYDMGYGMTESVDRHALDNTIHDDIRALCDHDSRIVLGRTIKGSLELRVDDHGLFARIKINPNDSDAMNTWARVQRGDVDQASFGFRIIREDKTVNGDKIHWTLKDIKLYEITVCTFPAYESTSLSARADERRNLENRKFELWKEQQKVRISKWH